MSRSLLLYNPAAGRFPLSQKRLRSIVGSLYRYGIACDAVQTLPGQDPSTWLNLENKDLLIVYGGDGTLHQVIGEAVRCNVPVALLPAGTENVLARELGIPRDPERALAVVARKKLRRIHLGRGNGRYFHLMTGIGLDADVVSRLREPLKKMLGAGAYWIATAQSLLKYSFRPFTVDLEGELHQATFAVVGNSRGYGGQLLLTPQASLNERCLDVCLFTSDSRVRYPSYLLGVFFGRHLRYPDVIYRKVQRLQVWADGHTPIQMDGERIGCGAMELTSVDEQLQVVVP